MIMLVYFSFAEKLKVEVDLMSRQKDIEKAHAISAIRTETDAAVARAMADREEFLNLYTKVRFIGLSIFPFQWLFEILGI